MFATQFQTTESSSVFCSLLFHVNKVVQKDLYTPLRYNFSFITSNHIQNSSFFQRSFQIEAKLFEQNRNIFDLKKEKKEQKT